MNLRRKKVVRTALIAIISLVVIIVVMFKSTVDKPLKIKDKESVTITEGESFYNFLGNLKSEGKIKNTFILKVYAKITGIDLDIIPGEYVLSNDMSLKEIIETLQSTSEANMVNFTIPEGFSIEDIAEKLDTEGLCLKEDFINAVKEYPLPPYVQNNSKKRYNLEGFLFPDTYRFEKGITPSEIIKTFLNRFEEVWNEIVTELNIDVKEEDIEKVVTIASMIEKEARVDEDRAKIASVIYNRLEQDMPLQLCATAIYALGYHVDEVLDIHTQIDSPYNTYYYKGLPVGPISNPGAPSIIAALKPEKTDYLFYILADDNKHYFTNNYDDFLNKKEELGY